MYIYLFKNYTLITLNVSPHTWDSDLLRNVTHMAAVITYIMQQEARYSCMFCGYYVYTQICTLSLSCYLLSLSDHVASFQMCNTV